MPSPCNDAQARLDDYLDWVGSAYSATIKEKCAALLQAIQEESFADDRFEFVTHRALMDALEEEYPEEVTIAEAEEIPFTSD